MIFGKGAATPFEEACEITADFEILFASALAIAVAESDQQLIKRFLCQRPFLHASEID